MTPTDWHELMIVCSALSFTICFIAGLIYYHTENERKRKERAKERKLKYKALKQSRQENKELSKLLKQIKDIYN